MLRVNSSPLVTHICISVSGQHWFSEWLVAYSAPSHYLNQCWLIVNWTLKNKLQRNSNKNTKLFTHENEFENVICEMAAILSRGRWVNKALINQKDHWPVMVADHCIHVWHTLRFKPGQISKRHQLYTWPTQVWCLWTISYWFLDGINDQQLCRGLPQASMFSGMIITEWESVDKLANCETRGLITTLRPEQNGCHFADYISKLIFLKENVWILNTISLKCVPHALTDCKSTLVQLIINTLRQRQNGRHFPDDILKLIFLNENVWISSKISLKFVPRGPINNMPALVQIMAWRRPGAKPLSGPMMVRLLTHICVTRPQWVKRNKYLQTGSLVNTIFPYLQKIKTKVSWQGSKINSESHATIHEYKQSNFKK